MRCYYVLGRDHPVTFARVCAPAEKIVKLSDFLASVPLPSLCVRGGMLLDMQNCVFTVQRSIMQKKRRSSKAREQHAIRKTLAGASGDPFASSLISRNHRAEDGNSQILLQASRTIFREASLNNCLRKSEAIRNDLRKINRKSRHPHSAAKHTSLAQDGRRAPEELHMFY